MIAVEVCHLSTREQFLVRVTVPDGATIRDAIEASGIRARFPALEVSDRNVGVFSQLRPLDAKVEAGDRIEIYRPLVADPKEIRRERASRNPLKRLR